MDKHITYVIHPTKSTALAILLAVVLGPIGVLYSTMIGAFILLVLFLVALGSQSLYLLALVWLIGCFLTTFMVRRHNRAYERAACV